MGTKDQRRERAERLHLDVDERPAAWLTQSHERELIRRVQTGNRRDREIAVEILLRAFELLLRAQIRRVRRQGTDEEDLEQVARLAFVRATERFDLGLSSRLSSYARAWVEGAVRREAATAGLVIKLPREEAHLVRQVEARRVELATALGREPTSIDLASDLEVAVDDINRLLQLPRKVELQDVLDGESGAGLESPRRRGVRVMSTAADDVDETVDGQYSVHEVGVLVAEYQALRSGREVRTMNFGDPRLCQSGRNSDVRLIDLDRALQRLDGSSWVVVELIGLRGLSLRAVERLFGVRHSTLQYRYKTAVDRLVELMNSSSETRVRRHVFWRGLYVRDVGPDMWLFGEDPVSFEVWARIAGAESLLIGGRTIPVRALAAFGEGWLITRELMGRREGTTVSRT